MDADMANHSLASGIPMTSAPGANLTDMAMAMAGLDTKNMNKITLYCLLHPNLTNGLCQTGLYGYPLNFSANVAFTSLFIVLLLCFVIVYVAKRQAVDFVAFMFLGCLCEVLGYVGRTWSQKDQFDVDPFILQICCLTIGPAFFAAAIYVCLRRIVQTFGPSHSRIPPEWYTRFFIPCDIVSLILQGAGGGLAAIAFKRAGKLKFGNNVMLAGLSFQVFTMFLFTVASLDFAIRVNRSIRVHGQQILDQTESMAAIRASRMFKPVMFALGLATLCIFVRCCFRVAELSGGWTGPLMKNQTLFVVFEGLMVFTAAAILAVFNPCFCFKDMPGDPGRIDSEKILHTLPRPRKTSRTSQTHNHPSDV